MFFNKRVSKELAVCISQHMATDYTRKALEALKADGIPFTSIVLFDGTPPPNGIDEIDQLDDIVDISIRLKEGIHSLPHIWNILWGVAKLSQAKYMLWQDCDIELKSGSLKQMLDYCKDYSIVSPVKIDQDREKFNNYKRVLPSACYGIAGFNDSVFLINLESLPFFALDYEYAPYQFENSELGYVLWRNKVKSCLVTDAVAFHNCSKDIKHSPEERVLGSNSWDKKKEIFLKEYKDEKTHLVMEEANSGFPVPEIKLSEWFLKNSIMNSENANKVGFPCYIYE